MSEATIATRRETIAATPANRTLVSAWLLAVCFMIWIMVGIGGYTRDTGSGLSIMNWDPIVGAVPPLTAAAWQNLFTLYKTIPQAQILHPNIDLAGFQSLFWPEYIHRLWGRLLGVVFLLPLLGFIATGRIERRLIPWLVLLFILGGLQGAIGWFMVASGFDPNSVAVEPWRLSLHFCFAMFLYIAVLWTAFTVRRPNPARHPRAKKIKIATHISVFFLCLTMFAGTFVSGTHAIDVFNASTGAGMGQPPAGYGFGKFFTDKATILFNHQLLATLTTIAVITTGVLSLRSNQPRPVYVAGLAIAVLVLVQFGLGMTALISKMLDIGVAHQMNAVLLLTACLFLMHNMRGATR